MKRLLGIVGIAGVLLLNDSGRDTTNGVSCGTIEYRCTRVERLIDTIPPFTETIKPNALIVLSAHDPAGTFFSFLAQVLLQADC